MGNLWAMRRQSSESSHQEQVPRKQGLKLLHTTNKATRLPPSRASSTKTRIETPTMWRWREPPRCIKSKFHENKDWNEEASSAFLTGSSSRASSTKTRIETRRIARLGDEAHRHQEQVPRKQGLKQYHVEQAVRDLMNIKSKFHENKDWNLVRHSLLQLGLFIKSKFHENKDWNQCWHLGRYI